MDNNNFVCASAVIGLNHSDCIAKEIASLLCSRSLFTLVS